LYALIVTPHDLGGSYRLHGKSAAIYLAIVAESAGIRPVSEERGDLGIPAAIRLPRGCAGSNSNASVNAELTVNK
jgi:hypothetical protein